MKEIEKLSKYCKEITSLGYTINLLNWELRVIAPEKSSDELVELISYHEDKLFKLVTSKKYGELIKSVIDSKEFESITEEEKRCIQRLLREYENNKKVPAKFYSEYVRAKNKANVVWKKAKDTNDYELFKPRLQKVIEYTKKYYRYIDPDNKNLYDVMLNEYELGVTSEIIDKLFNGLKKELIPLIAKVAKKEKHEYLKDNTEEELLRASKYLLDYIGFDNERGTLGIYPHGFTEKMCDDDVRIAFKHADKPLDFVSTIIHEGGHGIFEQNIPHYLSLYNDGGVNNLYGLHESQSRFFENILGRNKNFWTPIYNDIKEILHLDLSLDEFVKGLNTPVTSLIRTEADELTYCMHIIVRYEIERALFNGEITVDDLPRVWNEKMKEYLGVEVDTDANGLMQDVHWSEGAFGYFPSYLLGSIYDGIFKEVIEKELGNIDALLAKGEIKKITKYLTDNIYVHGGAYTSLEIIKKLYKKEVTPEPLIKYFKEKYEGKND